MNKILSDSIYNVKKYRFVHSNRACSKCSLVILGGKERLEVKRGGTSRDLLCVRSFKNQKNALAKKDERFINLSPAKHCKDIGKNFTLYIIFLNHEQIIIIRKKTYINQ